jgi:hypothetical protein
MFAGEVFKVKHEFSGMKLVKTILVNSRKRKRVKFTE